MRILSNVPGLDKHCGVSRILERGRVSRQWSGWWIGGGQGERARLKRLRDGACEHGWNTLICWCLDNGLYFVETTIDGVVENRSGLLRKERWVRWVVSGSEK